MIEDQKCQYYIDPDEYRNKIKDRNLESYYNKYNFNVAGYNKLTKWTSIPTLIEHLGKKTDKSVNIKIEKYEVDGNINFILRFKIIILDFEKRTNYMTISDVENRLEELEVLDDIHFDPIINSMILLPVNKSYLYSSDGVLTKFDINQSTISVISRRDDSFASENVLEIGLIINEDIVDVGKNIRDYKERSNIDVKYRSCDDYLINKI